MIFLLYERQCSMLTDIVHSREFVSGIEANSFSEAVEKIRKRCEETNSKFLWDKLTETCYAYHQNDTTFGFMDAKPLQVLKL